MAQATQTSGDIPNEIILFHYPFSPYARKVVWYLALRGISYAQCIQPIIMPRPDLEELGVSYRRIPLMAIGRDVYCDTSLILRKLEERHPKGKLGCSTGEQRAIEQLITKWITNAGIFALAARCIPPDSPVMKDPKFLKDRAEFSGRPWSNEAQRKGRPEALAGMREAYDLVETTLLSDGRDWLLGTGKPSLADVEAIMPFHWLSTMPGAIPPETASAESHPKVFAWLERFNEAVKSAKQKPLTLKGPAAVKAVKEAEFAEQGGRIDDLDPLKLAGGDSVAAYPLDSGATGKVIGKLVDLTPNEVTVAVKPKSGDNNIHVHLPRWGFRVAPISSTKL